MAAQTFRLLDLDETDDASAAAEVHAFPGAAAAPAPEARASLGSLMSAPAAEEGFAQHAYTLALAAGVVWAVLFTTYVLFDRSGVARFNGGPLSMLVFAAMLALPIAFMMLAAYGLRQGARIAAESQRARAIAGALMEPAALATAGAGDALAGLRAEVAAAAAAAADAGQTLTALREALKGEADLLTRAAAEANRATARLTTAFSRERQSMVDIGVALEHSVQDVTDSISRQSTMVVEASDLARAGAEQAQAQIAQQVADLSSAVETAATAARSAGEQLDGQTDRLERAAAFMDDRCQEMERSLSERHDALAKLGETLRDEQDHAETLLEGQRNRLAEAAVEARASAEVVTSAAQNGATALRGLEQVATGQAVGMAEASRMHQDAMLRQAEITFASLRDQLAEAIGGMEAESRRSIERMTAAAEAARHAAVTIVSDSEREAEAKLQAADAHLRRLAEIGRQAGDQAGELIDAALARAGKAAEESAAIAKRAGDEAEGRIQAGVDAARAAIADLSTMLQQVEVRAAALPAAAKEQVDSARRVVAQTVQEAIAATRDAGRAEAARATAAPKPPPAPSPAPTAAPSLAPAASAPPSTASLLERARALAGASAPPPTPAPRAEPAPAAAMSAFAGEAAGLRPRVKLSAMSPMLETVGAEADSGLEQDGLEREKDDWTWTDLLGPADTHAAMADGIDEQLWDEIQAMGVDPGALLPSARIDEITHALNLGDSDSARELVSRAAPAAIRRLSRRVQGDATLRGKADRHVRNYELKVRETTERDLEGHMTSALLSSEPGRAYLLLDAAFHEMQ